MCGQAGEFADQGVNLQASASIGQVYTPVSLGTRLKVKSIRGIFKVCCSFTGGANVQNASNQCCEQPGFPGASSVAGEGVILRARG